jgi:hypothetical protein
MSWNVEMNENKWQQNKGESLALSNFAIKPF